MRVSALRGWTTDVVDVPLPGKDHDAWAASPSAAAVVDGATPLEADWPQDLKDFAAAIADELVHDDPDRAMPAVWRDAILHLRARFQPMSYRRTAGAAMVRQVGHRLEFAVMGDVRCLIDVKGVLVDLIDPRLLELDERSARAATRAALVENRMLANTPAGYPIFGDAPEASEHLTTFSTDGANVDRFAIMSDGAWNALGRAGESLDALYGGALESRFSAIVARSGSGLTDDATILRFQR